MPNKVPISVVVTVLNEAGSVVDLLEGLVAQSVEPTEIVVVDGGSRDGTTKLVKKFAQEHAQIPIICHEKPGTIGVGRNYGVKLAKSNWIAFTDAGCIADIHWLAELWRVQQESKVKVVAGYYQGVAHNSFEAAQIPYVLVMPDRVDPATFLPASRSMLIEKKLFTEMGGFNEKLVVSEDYDLALRLRERIGDEGIGFAEQAIVKWRPRETLKEFAQMVYKQAYWDAVAGQIRTKAILVVLRYVIWVLWLVGVAIFKTRWLSISLVILWIFYLAWIIMKNARYVSIRAWPWLVVLQIMSDYKISLSFLNSSKLIRHFNCWLNSFLVSKRV